MTPPFFDTDFRAQVAGKGDGCGGFYEITSTSFSLSISRPNYGNSDFCSWYIYNSVSTGQLKLYFPTFDVNIKLGQSLDC